MTLEYNAIKTPFQKISVPLDHSLISQVVFEKALDLATALKAKLLLHDPVM